MRGATGRRRASAGWSRRLLRRWCGSLARGRKHGYDRASVREGLAASFYDEHHRVDRALHAITRNRMLTGQALGYAPNGPLDFGLDRSALMSGMSPREAVLLHATARPE